MKKIIYKIIYLIICINFSNSLIGQCSNFITLLSSAHPISPCLTGAYNLVFEDNFNGNSLDTTTKWELVTWRQGPLTNDCDGSSKGLELNRLENIDVSNGTLKIIADNQPVWGKAVSWKPANDIMCDGLPNFRLYNYTSSNIWTQTKFKALGKYEIRCRMPNGKGFWPAFWAYSGDGNTAGGERWNELDILDNTYGNDDYTGGVLYDYYNDGDREECRWSTPNIPDFSQWHIFTFLYLIDKAIWYIDGNPIMTKYRRFDIAGNAISCGSGDQLYLREEAFPIDDMQIILNLAINRDNSPDQNTVFPSAFEIDYVRYWEGPQPAPTQCGYDANVTGIFSGTFPGLNQMGGVDNITFSGNALLLGSSTVTAANSIHILPNFYAAPTTGNFLHLKIDPLLCNQNLRISENADSNNTGFNIAERETNLIQRNNEIEEEKLFIESNNTPIQVFPNPNNGQFNVLLHAINGTVKLELTDLLGNVIMTEHTTKNNYTFGLSGYPKGMYLLKITIDSTVSVHKIIYQ